MGNAEGNAVGTWRNAPGNRGKPQDRQGGMAERTGNARSNTLESRSARRFFRSILC